MMFQQWVCAALLFALTFAVRADFILSSPSRLPKETETAMYQPIAELLSRVTGEKIVYRYPGSYLMYQRDMREGKYDVVFDGPAFIDWRIKRLGHTVTARLDGDLTFVVLTRQDNMHVQSLASLAGRPVCSFPPPHLTTLTLLAEYQDVNIPRILMSESFEEIYKNVTDGQCEAGVLPIGQYQKLDGQVRALRPVFISQSLPNQAFTVSKRLRKHAGAIAAALTDPVHVAVLKPLLESFKAGAVVRASSEDYHGMSRMLKGEFGFD